MQTVTYIGFLHSGSKENFVGPFAVLKAELPKDVEIIDIWGDDDAGMLANGAADLVGNKDVVAIVAAGGPDPALRLQRETKLQNNPKPIVFTTVADPKASELVDSTERPGTNLTGMAGKTSELDAARLILLNAFLGGRPGDKFGVLRLDSRDHGDDQYKKVVDAAKPLGLELKDRKANTKRGIDWRSPISRTTG